jgi:DNA-binding NarL/FixJ family response regulator
MQVATNLAHDQLSISPVERLPVLVATDDPLSRAGIEAQLQPEPSIRLIGSATSDPSASDAVVAVVVADSIDEGAISQLRRLRADGVERCVVVVTRLDDAGLLLAVENGVNGLLRRAEATTKAIVRTLHTVASGEGVLPPDLLGRFMDQVGSLQRRVLSPRGLAFAGLTEREAAVLSLIADGHDTAEVGRRLFYSDRTVKNVIHNITSRFDLRNRTHAVAFAIREGYI